MSKAKATKHSNSLLKGEKLSKYLKNTRRKGNSDYRICFMIKDFLLQNITIKNSLSPDQDQSPEPGQAEKGNQFIYICKEKGNAKY